MTIRTPSFELVRKDNECTVTLDLDPERRWSGVAQWADPVAAQAELRAVLAPEFSRLLGSELTDELVADVDVRVHQTLLRLVKEERLWHSARGWEIGARSPVWTRERPTVEGLYWVHGTHNNHEPPGTIVVSFTPAGDRCWSSDRCWSRDWWDSLGWDGGYEPPADAMFSGPIALPAPGENAHPDIPARPDPHTSGG